MCVADAWLTTLWFNHQTPLIGLPKLLQVDQTRWSGSSLNTANTWLQLIWVWLKIIHGDPREDVSSHKHGKIITIKIAGAAYNNNNDNNDNNDNKNNDDNNNNNRNNNAFFTLWTHCSLYG